MSLTDRIDNTTRRADAMLDAMMRREREGVDLRLRGVGAGSLGGFDGFALRLTKFAPDFTSL